MSKTPAWTNKAAKQIWDNFDISGGGSSLECTPKLSAIIAAHAPDAEALAVAVQKILSRATPEWWEFVKREEGRGMPGHHAKPQEWLDLLDALTAYLSAHSTPIAELGD